MSSDVWPIDPGESTSGSTAAVAVATSAVTASTGGQPGGNNDHNDNDVDNDDRRSYRSLSYRPRPSLSPCSDVFDDDDDDDDEGPDGGGGRGASDVPDEDDEEDDDDDGSTGTEDDGLPFPGYAPVTFFYFQQTSVPRRLCLQLITWPYPLSVFIL